MSKVSGFPIFRTCPAILDILSQWLLIPLVQWRLHNDWHQLNEKGVLYPEFGTRISSESTYFLIFHNIMLFNFRVCFWKERKIWLLHMSLKKHLLDKFTSAPMRKDIRNPIKVTVSKIIYHHCLHTKPYVFIIPWQPFKCLPYKVILKIQNFHYLNFPYKVDTWIFR